MQRSLGDSCHILMHSSLPVWVWGKREEDSALGYVYHGKSNCKVRERNARPDFAYESCLRPLSSFISSLVSNPHQPEPPARPPPSLFSFFLDPHFPSSSFRYHPDCIHKSTLFSSRTKIFWDASLSPKLKGNKSLIHVYGFILVCLFLALLTFHRFYHSWVAR